MADTYPAPADVLGVLSIHRVADLPLEVTLLKQRSAGRFGDFGEGALALPRGARRAPRTRRERKARNAALARRAEAAGVSVPDLLRAREAAAALAPRPRFDPSVFSVEGTRTGRLPSSQPNLQRLSVRPIVSRVL